MVLKECSHVPNVVLRLKLLAFGTLVVSFIMTLITFFALSSIQKDAGMNDTRYARDLGLLLSGNVTELVANNQTRELFNVAEKFWRSSRNLRYIFFTDPDGFVKLGIPVSATSTESEEEGALQLTRKLKLPSELKKQPQFPLVRQHSTPQGQSSPIQSSPIQSNPVQSTPVQSSHNPTKNNKLTLKNPPKNASDFGAVFTSKMGAT